MRRVSVADVCRQSHVSCIISTELVCLVVAVCLTQVSLGAAPSLQLKRAKTSVSYWVPEGSSARIQAVETARPRRGPVHVLWTERKPEHLTVLRHAVLKKEATNSFALEAITTIYQESARHPTLVANLTPGDTGVGICWTNSEGSLSCGTLGTGKASDGQFIQLRRRKDGEHWAARAFEPETSILIRSCQRTTATQAAALRETGTVDNSVFLQFLQINIDDRGKYSTESIFEHPVKFPDPGDIPVLCGDPEKAQLTFCAPTGRCRETEGNAMALWAYDLRGRHLRRLAQWLPRDGTVTSAPWVFPIMGSEACFLLWRDGLADDAAKVYGFSWAKSDESGKAGFLRVGEACDMGVPYGLFRVNGEDASGLLYWGTAEGGYRGATYADGGWTEPMRISLRESDNIYGTSLEVMSETQGVWLEWSKRKLQTTPVEFRWK